jgi:hypothetical protein
MFFGEKLAGVRPVKKKNVLPQTRTPVSLNGNSDSHNVGQGTSTKQKHYFTKACGKIVRVTSDRHWSKEVTPGF